jgi:hypothetical protein
MPEAAPGLSVEMGQLGRQGAGQINAQPAPLFFCEVKAFVFHH